MTDFADISSKINALFGYSPTEAQLLQRPDLLTIALDAIAANAMTLTEIATAVNTLMGSSYTAESLKGRPDLIRLGIQILATDDKPSTPSGTDTQVQFNDDGAFGGDAGLTYNKTTDALSVTGSVIAPRVVAAATSGRVNLILQATGTGAIQSLIADNTATGGNARGQYAVDFQRIRTAATQVASGNYSFVVGQSNRASGTHSFVTGAANNASGNASFAIGGGNSANSSNSAAIGNSNVTNGTNAFAANVSNIANGSHSTVFGNSNTVDGQSSFACGETALSRDPCQFALGSSTIPSRGTSQYNIFPLGVITTNATPTTLALTGTSQITLQNNSAMRFNILVIATVSGGGNTSGWELKGVIKRGANAASTALVGTVTTTLVGQDAGASGWAIAATANTTTGGLTITATGQAGTTIRWVATVECAEVAF